MSSQSVSEYAIPDEFNSGVPWHLG